jgi:two-component system cell cycle response regulator DivK
MREKILIVDDNPVHMRLVEMILRTDDYILLKAFNGEEALDIATREHPDLVLMDLNLPKMNGFEVIKRLKENPVSSQASIIAITAYAMKGDREKVLELGCDEYVSKPINTRELSKTITRILSQRIKDNA